MHRRIDLPIKAFINRDKETAMLKNLVLEHQQGARVIVVKGNVGVGKTRLVQEVIKTIEWRDVIWGDCSYLADYVAYYAIRELVEFLIRTQGTQILENIKPKYKKIVGKLIPEVLGEGVDKIKDTEPLVDKFAFYEGVKQILDAGARAKIIVIDNLQWIDQASTNLLRYLIKAQSKEMVAYVCIYRTDEETEVVNTFLSALRKTEKVTDVTIEAFSKSNVQAIVEAVIGEEPTAEFVDYVYRWSGGNPFYLEEIISALVLHNCLTFDHGHWFFSEPESETVPKTIADIAKAKYLSLTEDAQQVLEIASIIGWFDVHIIQEITGLEPVRIVEMVEEISNTGMVHYGEDKIEFSDEISRNAVYEQAHETKDVEAVHRTIGDVIKQRSRGNENSVIPELAYHYFHGMDRDKGVRFCIRAGDRACEQYAHQEAIRYYTWAIELLKGSEKHEKFEMIAQCLDKRIKVYDMVGDHERSLKDIHEGIELVGKLNDHNWEIDMLHKLAYTYQRLAKPREALREAEHVTKLALDAGDLMRAARADMLIANIQLQFGNSTKALDRYTKALEYFDRVDDKKTMSSIHSSLGTLYQNMGKLDQARHEQEQALKLAEKVGDQRTIAACFIGMGNIHHIRGNYDEALKSYNEAHVIYKDIGFKQGIAIACGSIGNAYVALGQYRHALKFIVHSLNMKREIEDKRNEAGDLANLSGIHTYLGEYPKAINALENALRIAQDIEDARLQAYVLDHLGIVYYYMGNFPYAHSLHQQAQKLIKQKNFEIGQFYNQLFLGRLHLAQEKYVLAKSCIDTAYETAEHLASKTMMADATMLMCKYFLSQGELDLFSQYIGRVLELSTTPVKSLSAAYDLLFGEYYFLKKEYTTAIKVLRSALKAFEELEEQYNIGKVYYYLGMCEKAKGNHNDHRAYMITARGIFEAINAKAWGERIEKELLQ